MIAEAVTGQEQAHAPLRSVERCGFPNHVVAVIAEANDLTTGMLKQQNPRNEEVSTLRPKNVTGRPALQLCIFFVDFRFCVRRSLAAGFADQLLGCLLG